MTNRSQTAASASTQLVAVLAASMALLPTACSESLSGTAPKTTAVPEAAAAPAPADAPDAPPSNMNTASNPDAGYAIEHDPAWTVKVEGPSIVAMPTTTPADPGNPEFYGFSAVPWTGKGTLADARDAEAAVRLLLADAPGVRRDGGVEQVGDGGILVRCSGDANGRPMRMCLFARVVDAKLVGLVVLGDDATMTAREQTARTLFATLRRSEVRAPAPGGVAAADLAFAGRWSSDEVLSSGGGFGFGGDASMVTQRILELARDGTFTLGSRSAGGGSGSTFESGLSIDARGQWRIERSGGATYLVMRGTDGSSDRVRCTIYEGQLVLGESGSRKFFARLN